MSKQVNVKVDAGESGGVQEHLWRFIGYDECNYTYIPEGMELLGEICGSRRCALLFQNSLYVLYGQLPRDV